MTRLAWFTSTLAILTGLLAPVCALACVGDPASASAPQAAADASPHPCHESAPAPVPEPAPASHEGCGCDSEQQLVRSTVDGPTASADAVVVTFHRAPRVSASGAAVPSRVDGRANLPPPDLLLQKSSLLI